MHGPTAPRKTRGHIGVTDRKERNMCNMIKFYQQATARARKQQKQMLSTRGWGKSEGLGGKRTPREEKQGKTYAETENTTTFQARFSQLRHL